MVFNCVTCLQWALTQNMDIYIWKLTFNSHGHTCMDFDSMKYMLRV